MKPNPPPLKVEAPCPKRWEDLSGDSKRRFCEQCQLHVHNLSAMTADEREHFVGESGGRQCISYELRPDGSMVTPSRWTWLLQPLNRIQWAVVTLLAAVLPFLFSACAIRRTLGKPGPSCGASSRGVTDDRQHQVVLGKRAACSEPKKAR